MRMPTIVEYLLAVIVILLLILEFRFAAALIDVEIYENRETGKMFYCATGSLTDPPFRYVGSGAVPEGDESYC